MDLKLSGKRVFITASTGGIGLAVAEHFLQEGANVFVNGRNQDKLLHVMENFQQKYGKERVLGFCGDITSTETLIQCKNLISDSWKGLDILVPNLGTGKPMGMDRLDLQEWNEMFRINLFSAVKLIQMFHDMLAEGKNASIVLISSIVAYEKMNAPYAYAAAKNGIRTLGKYLSGDLAKECIRVNIVVPGNVYFAGGRWEELSCADPAGVKEYIEQNVPMKRFGTPEEIADAVVFLASERASFVTGTEFVIDGGQKKSLN